MRSAGPGWLSWVRTMQGLTWRWENVCGPVISEGRREGGGEGQEGRRGNQYVWAMTHRCWVFIASGGKEGGVGVVWEAGQHHCTADREWWRERREKGEREV